MQRHNLSSLFLIFSLLFLFLFSLSLLIPATAAETPSNNSSSSSSACKSTLYPKLCRSILSAVGSNSPSGNSPYNYGKFSVKQCLKRTRKMSELINRYLYRRRASGDRYDAGAVEDCRQLLMLNVEFLESIAEELQSADDQSMSGELVDRIRARLSAIVTNHQTCYDGLVEAKSGILLPRGNGTMAAAASLSAPVMFDLSRLYSVSLGLVTHALAKNLKHHHKRQKNKGESGNGLFPAAANLHRKPLAQFIKVRPAFNFY